MAGHVSERMILNKKSSPSLHDARPPNSPWQPLPKNPANYATLTFYFSDSRSEIVPVRDISCRGDPKPDPNFETQTYGLFSDCCKDERKSIAEKGLNFQFFCTSRRDNIRVLTGYYHPAWYCLMGAGDYAIAADYARFISPGYVLSDLVPFLNGYLMDRFVRRWKYIPERVAKRLLFLINSVPAATSQYISEVKVLEGYSLKKNGLLYHDRTTGFSWEEAAKVLKK